jgi:hypothetical protein
MSHCSLCFIISYRADIMSTKRVQFGVQCIQQTLVYNHCYEPFVVAVISYDRPL